MGEWAAEQGVEELVVAAPPGASEEEISDLTLKVQKLQEKKEEKAEGEEEAAADGEEEVPVDEELESAIKALKFEGNRRYNGIKINGAEESMRWLSSLLSCFVSSREKVPEGYFLWENIFPHDHTGVCTLNKGGKYAVRLWLQAEWRTIWVDDSMPFDEAGKPMLPLSSLTGTKTEIWPMLLAKAALKAHQGLSVGDPVSDAMAYATAITGWLCSKRARKEFTFDQWPMVKRACKDQDLMIAACALKEGGLVPAGFKGNHAHSITQCVELLGQPMVRLESGESKCATLLYREKEKAAKKPSTIEGESIRCQLEGALEVYAQVASKGEDQCSFWMSGSDFDAAFDNIVIFYNVSRHEHKYTEAYEWENLESPLLAPPCLLIQTEHETPQEITISLSVPRSSWEPPESPPEDGDEPKPDAAVKPPPPMTHLLIEEWSWEGGPVKRVGQGSTTHNVSVSFRVPAGKKVYRLHLDTVIGYTVYASSSAPFSLGDYETILKEKCGIASVSSQTAPTAAVPAGRTMVVFRTDVMLEEETTVAAYLQVTNPALKSQYRLRLIDNDKSSSVPYMSLYMPGKKLPKTERGYTFTLECTATDKAIAMSSEARIIVVGDKEGLTTSLSNLESGREVNGEQELNLSKDTVLLKYLMEPSTASEVASFELIVNGCERMITMELLDKDQKVLQLSKGLHQTMLVYVPLPGGDDDNYTLLCTIMAPDADLMAHEAESMKEAKKKAMEEGGEDGVALGASMKCDYSFTIYSLTGYAVSVDTRRQDHAISLKGEWESAEGGRAERAKGARDKFLAPPAPVEGEEEVNLGAKDPSKAIRPKMKDAGFDQALAKVISTEARNERLENKEKELEEYKVGQEAVQEQRLQKNLKHTALSRCLIECATLSLRST